MTLNAIEAGSRWTDGLMTLTVIGRDPQAPLSMLDDPLLVFVHHDGEPGGQWLPLAAFGTLYKECRHEDQ